MTHTHVIGRPGSGKSTALESMIMHDVCAGHGVALIDPHGDLVERILGLIPEEHADRVIYFNPGDPEYVPIWNPMTAVSKGDLTQTANNLVAAFKNFVSGWGHRLEHLLRFAILALLHKPGSTLLDVSNLLQTASDKRKALAEALKQHVTDDVLWRFLDRDLKGYNKNDLAPVQHKLSSLLSGGTVSRMLSQPNCSFRLREVMDEGKILLIDLSSVGDMRRDVLGSLMLGLLHAAALTRSDTPPAQRRPFHVFCDEAHRFVTDALDDLIAETRKFGVSLTLAHQYFSQFPPEKVHALFSTATTIIFNVRAKDAAVLVQDLRDEVEVRDLVTLDNWEAILRCGTEICRFQTFPPPPIPENNCRDRIVAESRRRYCRRADERDNADRPGGVTEAAVSPPSDEEFAYDAGF